MGIMDTTEVDENLLSIGEPKVLPPKILDTFLLKTPNLIALSFSCYNFVLFITVHAGGFFEIKIFRRICLQFNIVETFF
jgi:hypothetical protein